MMPAGLRYFDDYLSSAEEKQLLVELDGQPWLADLRRRVQHYGYRYDYKARRVVRDMYLGPLPMWAQPLAARISREGYMQSPDQLIVNEYLPGQGITPHVDCVPCFGPVVASISLGSACVMQLSRGSALVPLVLKPRSLLVLTSEARTEWRHAIAARRSDIWEGARHPRERRVSLTFRTVRLSVE